MNIPKKDILKTIDILHKSLPDDKINLSMIFGALAVQPKFKGIKVADVRRIVAEMEISMDFLG